MLKTETQRVVEIPLSQIRQDPSQPRKDFSEVDRLARSMKHLGQLQPILVTEFQEEQYMIVEGDSRYQAAESLEWETLRCIVMEVEDSKRRDVQFAANFMRSELNPFELAEEFHRIMIEHDISQAKLAEELGESESTISATLKLHSLLPEIKKRLAPISRSIGTEALVLVSRAKTSEAMEKLVSSIESGATVAELRKTSKALKKSEESAKDKSTPEETYSEAESESVSEAKAIEEPCEVIATEPEISSLKAQSFDEEVVAAWWKLFSVHAVRAKDLLEALPADLKLNTKTLATWIDGNSGKFIGEHGVITVSLAPGKVVYQLIPKGLNRPDYQQEMRTRCEEHRLKSIR